MAQVNPASVNRAERVLAYMVATCVGLSIICFVAMLVGTAAGVTNFGEGLWPVVIVLPGIGLPIGFVLLIALFIVSALRRGRETRDARN